MSMLKALPAAALLFLLATFLGLYIASLTAESFVQALDSLPADIDRLVGRISSRISMIWLGSNPLVGSSSTNTSGSCIKAAASPTRCL